MKQYGKLTIHVQNFVMLIAQCRLYLSLHAQISLWNKQDDFMCQCSTMGMSSRSPKVSLNCSMKHHITLIPWSPPNNSLFMLFIIDQHGKWWGPGIDSRTHWLRGIKVSTTPYNNPIILTPREDGLWFPCDDTLHKIYVKKKTRFSHVFPIYIIVGLSKVWNVGNHWMWNLIMHPTSAYIWSLNKYLMI